MNELTVQKFMITEIEKACQKAGITTEWIVNEAKELFAKAKKDNTKDALAVLKLIKELQIDLRMKKVEISHEEEGDDIPVSDAAAAAHERGKQLVGTGQQVTSRTKVKVTGQALTGGEVGPGVPVDVEGGDQGSSAH